MALTEREVEKGAKVFSRRVHNLSQNRRVTLAFVVDGRHRLGQEFLCRHYRCVEDSSIEAAI